MGGGGLVVDDPLLDQFGKQTVVGFGPPVDELLVRGEFAHFAERDDVVLDARDDAVHNLLCGRRRSYGRRLRCGAEQQDTQECDCHGASER